jgi:predicted DNA repair protein MutK
VAVLTGIALLMTVGVYGFVAGIVKLDDAGVYLRARANRLQRAVGAGILRAAPLLMKALSFAGTAAMFLVGGGILTHGVPALHHWIEGVVGHIAMPSIVTLLATPLLDMLVAVVAGALVLALVTLGKRVLGRRAPSHSAPRRTAP